MTSNTTSNMVVLNNAQSRQSLSLSIMAANKFPPPPLAAFDLALVALEEVVFLAPHADVEPPGVTHVVIRLPLTAGLAAAFLGAAAGLVATRDASNLA